MSKLKVWSVDVTKCRDSYCRVYTTYIVSVSRITGSGPQMEFEFVAENASARQIMKLWSIAVMESASPRKRNELSNFLITKNRVKHPDRKSKSFRTGKTAREVSEHLKRTGSLPRSRNLEARIRRGLYTCTLYVRTCVSVHVIMCVCIMFLCFVHVPV